MRIWTGKSFRRKVFLYHNQIVDKFVEHKGIDQVKTEISNKIIKKYQNSKKSHIKTRHKYLSKKNNSTKGKIRRKTQERNKVSRMDYTLDCENSKE